MSDYDTKPLRYVHNPEDWLLTFCQINHYNYGKVLPHWRYAAVSGKSIIVGDIGDYTGMTDRWDYADQYGPLLEIIVWDGTGDPNGWIRNPRSGRRVSQGDTDYDENGRQVPVGETYYRS